MYNEWHEANRIKCFFLDKWYENRSENYWKAYVRWQEKSDKAYAVIEALGK